MYICLSPKGDFYKINTLLRRTEQKINVSDKSTSRVFREKRMKNA